MSKLASTLCNYGELLFQQRLISTRQLIITIQSPYSYKKAAVVNCNSSSTSSVCVFEGSPIYTQICKTVHSNLHSFSLHGEMMEIQMRDSYHHLEDFTGHHINNVTP